MRMITTGHITAAILAVTLAMPVAAMAQTKDLTAANQAQTEGRQAKVEQRIADMYATLKITPAQNTEWNKFAQVMMDNAQSMDMFVSKDSAGRESQPADQVLKGYAEFAELHAQNVQKLATAFGPLYASLTPDQKKQADDMFRQRAEQRDQNQKQGAATPAQPGTKNGG